MTAIKQKVTRRKPSAIRDFRLILVAMPEKVRDAIFPPRRISLVGFKNRLISNGLGLK